MPEDRVELTAQIESIHPNPKVHAQDVDFVKNLDAAISMMENFAFAQLERRNALRASDVPDADDGDDAASDGAAAKAAMPSDRVDEDQRGVAQRKAHHCGTIDSCKQSKRRAPPGPRRSRSK